jgi:predicted dehydrogenase
VPESLRIAFLGCGFITGVHSQQIRRTSIGILRSYASRDLAKAERFCQRYGGHLSYGDYTSAINDPAVDAVVIAVPPRFHLDLTLQALDAGKHVLVEKPAYLTSSDYEQVRLMRDKARRVVMVGENDHYKPLATCLRRILREDTIGQMLFAHFTTLAKRLKLPTDWRNSELLAGGDAFFEEGIHWLHLANSLGPQITSVHGYRPNLPPEGADSRAKSMMVAFRYNNGAVGTLHYSREVPSLLRGLRLSKIYGRRGIVTFESNGVFVLVRGQGLPRLLFPGFRDMRGYQAMYRDFVAAIRQQRAPEMSLEIAMADQVFLEQIYATNEE